MTSERHQSNHSFLLKAVATGAVLALILMAAGYGFFLAEVAKITREKYQVLSSIGGLKANQIQLWRKARLADVTRAAHDSQTIQTVERFLGAAGGQSLQAELRECLKDEVDDEQADTIFLFDPSSNLLTATGEAGHPMPEALQKSIRAALASQGAGMSGFIRSPSGDVYIDVAAAVRDREGRPLAVLVLHSHVGKSLLSLLEFWPTASRSTETVFAQQEGEEVVFVNKLRNATSAPMERRFPLTQTSLPAVQAALGKQGQFEGSDYRDVEVLTDLRPIPGSPWFVVSKVDRQEILDAARFRAGVFTLAIGMFILLLAAGLTYYYRRRQGRILLRLGKAKAGWKQSEDRMSAITNAALDAILMMDPAGRISYWNPAAERIFGYTSDEAIGRNLHALIVHTRYHPAHRAAFPAFLKTGEGNAIGKTLALEALRKDGTEIAVHLSLSAVQIDGDWHAVGVLRDITEQKQAQEELAESETRFAQLAEQSRTFVWEVDADGLYTYASHVAESVLGYPPCEFVGRMHFYDLHPENERQAFQDAAFQVFEAKGSFNNLENSALTKDGRTVWLSTNGIPLLNADGSLRGYRGSDKDITERKEAEGELRRKSAQINSLLDSDPDIVFFKNTEGVYLGCNPAFVELVGQPRNEIVGKTDHDLFDKDVADFFREQDRQMLALGKPRHNEEWVTYPDGRKALLDTMKTPYWGADGELVGVLGISRDITQQKQAEADLASSAERLALATEAGEVGIWDYDIANNRLVWDDQMFRLYGITREQFGGAYEAWTAGVHPEDRVRGDAEIQMALRGEKEFNTEFRVLWPDGSIHNIRAIAKVKRDASGIPVHLVGTNWDITEQKLVESRLEEATAKAEKATAAKSEFLATMTHELRNPLTGVLGFAEILAGTPLDDEQQSYTEGIRESGVHLLSLINDVLDFSSIEKGALTIHPAPFDLAHLVKSSSELVRKSAADKGVAFLCDVGADVPAQITGDERRIRQILINLLANAIKFTSDGSVSLRVTRSGKFLDFSVEDTGIGISSEALSRLFQLFTQADSTINQKYGGTGIGLAVSQHLAEAMGGTISVVSVPGKGSTFTFRLPLEVSAGGMASVPSVGKNDPVEKSGGRCSVSADFSDPKNGTARSPSLQGTTGRDALPVLVVEDDRNNRLMVDKLLQSLGYRVEFAGNGAEAVDAFAPGKYLAILMDLRMPVMNGFEAAGIIRSRESGSRVPIIALSANVMSGSREIYLAAGMDDFLTKPFKKEELAAKLANVSQR